MPSRAGNLAVQGFLTGFNGYRLSGVSMAAGRKLGSKASLGVRVNYQHLGIAGYGTVSAISADAGLILLLSEKLHFGLQLLNLPGSAVQAGLYMPGIYSAGIGYDQSDQLYISVEAVKEQLHTLNAILGLQYKPVPQLLVRLSIQASEPSFVFGAGYTKDRLRFDVYSSYHLRLGIGTGIYLHWLLKNEATEK